MESVQVLLSSQEARLEEDFSFLSTRSVSWLDAGLVRQQACHCNSNSGMGSSTFVMVRRRRRGQPCFTASPNDKLLLHASRETKSRRSFCASVPVSKQTRV